MDDRAQRRDPREAGHGLVVSAASRTRLERSSEFDELRERARIMLAEKFGAARLWGWKDPRTTVTLPFWKELVPDAKYVICLRNPADAVSSIQRRPGVNLPVEVWGDV